MELIISTPEQLEAVVNRAIEKALVKALDYKPQPQQHDITGVAAASKFFEEQGRPVSPSKIYKETAAGNIRCKSFGTRLVFSPADLLAWIDTQTKDKHSISDIELAISRSARRKQKRG